MSPGFRHEAFLYDGEDEFLAGAVPFIADGLEAREPLLVAVDQRKIDLLRGELRDAAEEVEFTDMRELGRNPARIIPAWREFVRANTRPGQPARGIGEPIWDGRGEDELVECAHHEALLNVAFGEGSDWWLICPYDTGSLAPDVVDTVALSHPHLTAGGVRHESERYVEPHSVRDPLEVALSPPPDAARELEFGAGGLAVVRAFAREAADAAGLDPERRSDFVLAVDELATNSLRHAAGVGTARIWRESNSLVAEVEDDGRIGERLLGRRRPDLYQISGRGLWIVNQLCDLVQMRALPTGNLVRIHMRLG